MSTTQNDIRYTLNSPSYGQATITYYSSIYSSVVVPDTINYLGNIYDVVRINNGAFSGKTVITSLSLGKKLTYIGNRAFGNTDITSVIIPDNVVFIGVNAFYQCSSLTSVTIGSGLTEINANLFGLCTNLNNISIGKNVTTIIGYSFRGCSALQTITIPSSVTSIGENAFQDCTNLRSIYFLQTTTLPTFGTNVFQNTNSNLTAYYLSTVTNTTPLITAGIPNIQEYVPPIVCFKEGSLILTNNGYIPIQELKKGDLIKTLKHGYKPLDMIGKREIFNLASKNRIKDQLYKCDKKNYPEIFED